MIDKSKKYCYHDIMSEKAVVRQTLPDMTAKEMKKPKPETETSMAQSNITILAALIGLIAFMAVLAILIDFYIRRRRDRRISQMDELEGHDFEFFCADLLRSQGFIDVEVTRGSGDFGVDILAEKDGVTYAVQCKRYSGPVGVEAVLRTYGGLAYYERMVGAVMTNQYFTSPAVEAAKKLRILLWDRGYMDAMIEENNLLANKDKRKAE